MLTITKVDVTCYINSKANSWSPTTKTSEHARLRNIIDLVNRGPQALYDEGSKKWAPYTLKTVFVRVGELVEFVTKLSNNPFKQFMRDNANLFKGSYQKEVLDLTFSDAAARIKQIEEERISELAEFLLKTGTRASEALNYDGSGVVEGKGARKRKLFNLSSTKYPTNHGVTYSMLYKAMRRVGLKPHMIRKLVATQLVEAGFKEKELLHVFGWSSILTAAIYTQPKQEDELTKKMEEALKYEV
jgi:hypothetical protein